MFFEPCFSCFLFSLSFPFVAEIVRILRLIRSLRDAKLVPSLSSLLVWINASEFTLKKWLCCCHNSIVIPILFQLRLWFWLGFAQYLIIPAIFHHSWHVKELTCTLLGPRAHCSYVRLSVRLGCLALSVSESDMEIFFTNHIAARFLFFKTILSHFKSSWKL